MIRRLSSLQLESPSKSRSTARRPDDASKVASGNAQAITDDDIEVVPDSEDERIAARHVLSTKNKGTASPEIIEISSDDETPVMPDQRRRTFKTQDRNNNKGGLFDATSMPGAWPDARNEPLLSPRATKIKSYSARLVVISDSESDNDAAARDTYTKVSTDNTNAPPNRCKSRQAAPLEVGKKNHSQPRRIIESGDVDEVAESVYDDDRSVEDDGAILIFYNPPSARKPIPRQSRSQVPGPSKNPSLGKARNATDLHTDHIETPGGGEMVISDRTPSDSPSGASRRGGRTPVYPDVPDVFSDPTVGRGKSTKSAPTVLVAPTAASTTSTLTSLDSPRSEPGVPKTKAKTSRTPRAKKANTTPRISKKALAEAEQARRENFAQELFHELNASVFNNRLPAGTALLWNKRMQTTAGRARWHRSSQGVETTQIELATKVLDCDERIRNTLSHEMCHLASWVINRQPKENHGDIWQSWARKVLREHPDIHISKKHGYDIKYKYEWKCNNCDKIYGRHSKSIDHTACMCGQCKTGDLIPLFDTPPLRTPKVKETADSRMAAGWKRDSPTAIPAALRQPVTAPSPLRPKPNTEARAFVDVLDDMYDSDSHSETDHRATATRVKVVMTLSDNDEDGEYIYEINSDGDEVVEKLVKCIERVDLTSD